MGVKPAGLFHVSYAFQDADANNNSLSLKVPAGTLTAAEITEFAQEMALILNNATESKITKVAIQLEVSLPAGIRASPIAGSNNQEGGLFSFSVDGSAYRTAIRIPALLQSTFAGKSIDLTDPVIEAFTDGMIDGLDATGTMVQPSNKFEFDIDAVISGTKSFRRK